MEIRLATLEELPVLIELQTRAIVELSTHHHSALESVIIAEHQAQARRGVFETRFVAEVEGQIIGFATILITQPMIGAIYVDPQWVRQGVGSQLLKAVEAEAAQRYLRVLSVMSSLMAVPFYESQGYVVINSHRFEAQLGIWIHCQYLRKYLVPRESFRQWASRNWVILSVVILCLMVGFLSSRREPRSFEEPELIPPELQSPEI